jgi:hypothetical protein
MIPVKGRESSMASNAVSKPNRKTEAARKIASIIEEQMSELGLSESDKNKRVKSFGKRVDRAVKLRAKHS